MLGNGVVMGSVDKAPGTGTTAKRLIVCIQRSYLSSLPNLTM